MKKGSVLGSIAVLSVLVLTGWGCGTKSLTDMVAEKVAENAIENAIEKDSGGSADVDINSGSISFKNEDGTSVQYGQNVSIPADFPKAVPIYAGATPVATTIAGNEATATLTSMDSATDILAWYESQLNGWKKEQSFDTQAYYMRTYTKDMEKITVSVGVSDNTASITLYYQKEETK